MSKKLPLLTGLLFAATVAVQAQWVQQPISFSDASAVAVHIDAVDNSVAWTIGGSLLSATAGREFARTIDGGTTWTVGTITGLGPNDVPTSIYALDATTAWVTIWTSSGGGGRVLKTIDGGATWVVQTTATQFAGTWGSPDFVHFFNANEGVVVGGADGNTSGFQIYTTVNGGTSWSRVANVPAGLGLVAEFGLESAPATIGNSIWFASTQGRVYRSTDKGLTWAVSSTTLEELNALAFQDANNGLAVARNGGGTNHQLARTTDGGVTWNQVAYTGPLRGVSLDNVPGTAQFVSVGANFDIGDSGSSYSRDNGQTWVALENTINHYGLDFASATAGWSARIDATTSAGQGVNKFTSTVLGTRVATPEQLGFSVHPNPSADGRFVLTSRKRSAGTELRVTDALGREVMHRTWPGSAASPLTLDLAQYRAGVYTLHIEAEAGISRQKLVVQ